MDMPMQVLMRQRLNLSLRVPRHCLDATRAPRVRGDCMWIWHKTAQKESSARGLARAALDGASGKELLKEGMKALARNGPTGRLGVWLATDPNATPHDEIAAGFHGLVWDHGNRDTPKGWAHLSVEPPLPEELLLRGKTVEQNLESSPGNHVLGLLAGLHYALWVPIAWKEQLKGIILWGSAGKLPDVFRQQVESVAAELALALGFEELQRIARRRDVDPGVVRRFLSRQANDTSEALLSNLAGCCTQGLSLGARPGAALPVIGALPPQRAQSVDTVLQEC